MININGNSVLNVLIVFWYNCVKDVVIKELMVLVMKKDKNKIYIFM